MTFREWWLSQPEDIRRMGPSMTAIESAFEAGRRIEREACAKLCDEADKSTHPADLAYKIRQRGER
jgi:hypothetical protein